MKKFTNFYHSICHTGHSFSGILLLLMRLYWGSSFMFSGYGKLTHIESTASFFSSIEIPFPLFNAYFVGGVEFFGGFLLMIGLASRLVSIPLAITMLVALTAHLDLWEALFHYPEKIVKEAPFNYLLTSLIVFAFGAGPFSVDALIAKFFRKK